MSSNNPRRPSSRGSTPRPRRIAGQGRGSSTAEESVETPEATPTPDAGRTSGGAEPDAPGRASRELAGVLGSGRSTRVLIVAVGVLAVLLAGQAVWFFLHDGSASRTTAVDADRGAVSVPDGRPILAETSAAQDAADAAATALADIVSRGFRTYDEDVAAASEAMTEPFAAEYRETTDQIEDEFVENRTTVQARVVAQGVVRSDTTRAEVLVFLNQYVTKGPAKSQRTSYTPYRAVVTMVSTDQGWLVDGLDTR